MKTKLTGALILAATIALLVAIVPVLAYFNSISYHGQGFVADRKGGYDLRSEICGLDNGAQVDGPYLLWVLTAPGARNAEIHGPWGRAIMDRQGNGTFTYTGGWYSFEDLAAHPVKAAYDGRPETARLEVRQGCRVQDNFVEPP